MTEQLQNMTAYHHLKASHNTDILDYKMLSEALLQQLDKETEAALQRNEKQLERINSLQFENMMCESLPYPGRGVCVSQ